MSLDTVCKKCSGYFDSEIFDGACPLCEPEPRSCPKCKSIKRLDVMNSLLCSPCYHEAMTEAFLKERNAEEKLKLGKYAPSEGQKAWEQFCKDVAEGRKKI